MRDPYISENGVLLNKLHCRTQEELQEQEKWFSVSRIIELLENPVKGSFDLKHLQEIHRYIFQDVYPWAGEIRTVTIAKRNTLFVQWKI